MPANGDPSAYTVIAVSQDGYAIQAELSVQGAYCIPAENGVWRLEYQGPDGLLTKRVVKLLNYPIVVSTLIPGQHYANGERGTKLVGFDDLTHSDTLYEIPNAYGELDWQNWIATHQKYYGGYGYINGATSGEYVAYNSSGHPATIESSNPFDFLGAHVGVAWPQAEKGLIDIKAWRDNELIYHDRIRARTAGPSQFAADYEKVTRVEFSTDHYWQIVLDDIEISTVSSKQ